jgi:two-component system copper resistance phosphate regulon response regulator CusR
MRSEVGGGSAERLRPIPADPVVLVLGDDMGTAELLGSHLHDQGFSVRVAARHDTAEPEVLSEPDVIVLDRLSAHVEAPWDFDLREPPRPVVVVGRDDVDEMCEAFDRGAAGYVSNPHRPAEFAARLRATVRRGTPVESPPIDITVADVFLDMSNLIATAAGRKLTLTEREFRVLALLSTKQGVVVTRDELRRRCWGGSAGPRAIADRVRAVRRVVEDATRRVHIHTMRGLGYRLEVT